MIKCQVVEATNDPNVQKPLGWCAFPVVPTLPPEMVGPGQPPRMPVVAQLFGQPYAILGYRWDMPEMAPSLERTPPWTDDETVKEATPLAEATLYLVVQKMVIAPGPGLVKAGPGVLDQLDRMTKGPINGRSGIA